MTFHSLRVNYTFAPSNNMLWDHVDFHQLPQKEVLNLTVFSLLFFSFCDPSTLFSIVLYTTEELFRSSSKAHCMPLSFFVVLLLGKLCSFLYLALFTLFLFLSLSQGSFSPSRFNNLFDISIHSVSFTVMQVQAHSSAFHQPCQPFYEI